MPPHTSHLLQPLDVCCFGPLKRRYHLLAADKVGYEILADGKVRVNKDDFIVIYKTARKEAFHIRNVKSSFQTAGLIPYDPNYVISKVTIRLQTETLREGPTTPPTSSDDISEPRTPSYHKRLKELTSGIFKCLETPQDIQISPLKAEINNLVHIAFSATHSNAITAKQLSDVLATHQRNKRKNTRSRKRITDVSDISFEEFNERGSSTLEAAYCLSESLRELVDESSQP